jgi:hypothetical protein
MLKRIKKRAGSRWWRSVEITGCLMLVGGLAFILYALDSSIRTEENSSGHLSRVFTGCAVFFFGFVIISAARLSDNRWSCSRCGEQLRLKDDRACLRCQTVLE